MRIPLATLTLTLALSLPGLASADVYKCTDATGRVHYQNTPCTGEDAPAIVSPGPGSSATGPALPLRTPASPPPVHTPPPSPDGGRGARGGPVDTRTFGMLEIGSREREVLAKLGQPDRILEDVKTFVVVHGSGGGRELREKVRTAWVYDSDGYTLRTVLYFEDGRLVKKEKGR